MTPIQLTVPADVYTSKRALLDWLDANGQDWPLGTRLQVTSSDHKRSVLVQRMIRAPHHGKWRTVQVHEQGLAGRW